MNVSPRTRVRLSVVAAMVALATFGTQAAAQAATPGTSPIAAAPTTASIAATGPLAAHKTRVLPTAVKDFGGGTIFFPTNANGRTYASVVIAPGLFGKKSDVAWYGSALASQGFVVFALDTLDSADLEDARGAQMAAAATYLKTSSSVASRVDPARVSLVGYSMSGGGALQQAEASHQYRAIIALNPYDSNGTSFPKSTTPTLIITAQKDEIATPSIMGKPMYDSLRAPKQYVEVRNGTHETPQTKNTAIISAMTAFLQRYAYDDTRYTPFICPAPAVSATVSASQSSC